MGVCEYRAMYLKASINIKKLAVTQMMVSSDSCVLAAHLSCTLSGTQKELR